MADPQPFGRGPEAGQKKERWGGRLSGAAEALRKGDRVRLSGYPERQADASHPNPYSAQLAAASAVSSACSACSDC